MLSLAELGPYAAMQVASSFQSTPQRIRHQLQ